MGRRGQGGRRAEPTPNGYRVITRFDRGMVVISTVVPGLEIPVDTVLGDAE